MTKFLPTPKPRYQKQKRALRNPVPTIDNCCINHSGRRFASTHEIYGGKNRQTSIKNGFQVRLCIECHNEVTTNPKGKMSTNLKKQCQTEYEKTHTHDDFMKLIGQNYL